MPALLPALSCRLVTPSNAADLNLRLLFKHGHNIQEIGITQHPPHSSWHPIRIWRQNFTLMQDFSPLTRLPLFYGKTSVHHHRREYHGDVRHSCDSHSRALAGDFHCKNLSDLGIPDERNPSKLKTFNLPGGVLSKPLQLHPRWYIHRHTRLSPLTARMSEQAGSAYSIAG